MDIGLIFSAAGAAKSVAELLKIIDSMEAKLDRLVQSELNSGLRNIDQASRSEGEQVHLLREARNCFNRAVGLETGYRKGMSLIGCAMCHHLLGDEANCRRSLEELVELPPAVGVGTMTAAHSLDAAKDYFSWFGPFNIGPIKLAYNRTKLLFSSRARREYQRRMVLKAIGMNADAKSLMKLQQEVSHYVGVPVKWMKDLEIA
jgi:hypothetical protein